MQTIHFALDRAHFQGPGLIPFDSRECVYFFSMFVVLYHLRL